MTTLIKKDQIATGEFIKNPLPEDPWTSTTDTASLAAIAAKIAANGGGLPDILMGVCDRNIYQQSEISVYGDTTLIDIMAETGYCMLFLQFETDISAGEPIYSNFSQFTLYVNGSAVAAGDIESGDLCLLYCSGLDLYLVANDRWLKDIQGKQDELESGTNIRTVNGKSLLGSGDVELGDTLCYCIENSSDTTSSVVAMDVAHPSGFAPRNGSLIIAHFYSSVSAAAALTITGTALQNLYIVYHNLGITAGVINAGDNALILCYNNVAYVLTVDRQGGGASTLAALTDTAVSSPSAWQGLVYNPALSKWVNGGVLHAYRSYEHLVTANTGTLQLVCAAGESAHHTVTVDPSLTAAPPITINLQNYNDNCIVIMQGQSITYYPLTLLINGVQAGIVAKYGDGLGIMDNGGTTIIYTKARNVMISLRAVDATTPYVLSECFEIEVTPIT